jgi:hypothetical protein
MCMINQDKPAKLEQCELSQKREFDHTCSGRIDMSYPSNGNHRDVLHIKSSYENEDYYLKYICKQLEYFAIPC